jgi:hypothetical protein
MPKRGSVQLLLLFFRARARWLGTILSGVALLCLLHGEGHGLKSGIAQSLRQSAWRHALAGEPAQQPWPWDGATSAAKSPVPRLGLSAVVLTDSEWQHPSARARPLKAGSRASADASDPRLAFGDIALGDPNVTPAKGLRSLERVTVPGSIKPCPPAATPEADPHLPTCTPLDFSAASALRLIIDAAHSDASATTAPDPEQKL